MPYIEGESLRDRLREEHQLPVARGARDRPRGGRRAGLRPPRGSRSPRHQAGEHPAGRRGCDGGGLRHRPGVGRGGRGSADGAGIAIGTPAYMSPEQATRVGRPGRPHRPLRAGLRALRDARRRAAVHGEHVQAVLARHATDPVPSLRTVRPGVSPDLASGDHSGARQGAGGPLSHRGRVRRCARRAASRPGRHRAKRGRAPRAGRAAHRGSRGGGGLALTALFALRTHADRREVAALNPALVAIAPFRVASRTARWITCAKAWSTCWPPSSRWKPGSAPWTRARR